MLVQFSVVYSELDPGHDEHARSFHLEMDQVPRVGEYVCLPDYRERAVRTVVHYPWGNPEHPADEREPFTYVVLGPLRVGDGLTPGPTPIAEQARRAPTESDPT